MGNGQKDPKVLRLHALLMVINFCVQAVLERQYFSCKSQA